MLHNYVFKHTLDNVAESIHIRRPYSVYFIFITGPSDYWWKCEALLCYNHKNSNSQISGTWPWSLPYHPWEPWNNAGRVHPAEIIHIWLMSVTGGWYSIRSESGISLSSWSHCAWWYNQNPFRLRWLFNTLSKDSFLLSSLLHSPKEKGYVNTPYGKWNQSQHPIVSSVICYFTIWHAQVLFWWTL